MPLVKTLRPVVFVFLITASILSTTARAADLTVSAAISLTQAFKELGTGFETLHSGIQVHFNFASSDTLLTQISKGAPVDVFASADQETMDKAQAQHLLTSATRRDFASNELVVVVPAKGGLQMTGLSDLARPDVKRIAMGRPGGVPAGRYALQALEAAQLWAAVQPKAIYTTHVRQALDYVARGEVDAGLVYVTDAAAHKSKVKTLFRVPTPQAITYPIATTSGSSHAAEGETFIKYVLSPAGQTVLAKHGFGKP